MNKKRGVFVVFLVVTLLVLSINLSQSVDDPEGCYYYPQAEESLFCTAILQSEAQADCVNCDISQYFKVGSDCSELSSCREVKCSVDCQRYALDLCSKKGGVEVTADKESEFCNPGCCKIPQTVPAYCGFVSNKFQCEQYAKSYLGSVPDGLTFYNPAGMTQQTCLQEICRAETATSTISGFVKDKVAGTVLSGAEVSLEGKNKISSSDGNGKYTFTNLNPGNYQIKVSKAGYYPEYGSLLLQVGRSIEYNFSLNKAEGGAVLSGKVKDQSNNLLSDVKIMWSGPTQGLVLSNLSGDYQIQDLLYGNYTFTVRSPGFQESKINFELKETTKTIDFNLQPAVFSGVKGIAYIDINADKIADQTEQKAGVKIYLDGNLKSYSKYPDGGFEFEVSPEAHNISAIYQDYSYGPLALEMTQGQALEPVLSLLLTSVYKECYVGNEKPVEEFSGYPVKSEKEIKLEWKKPCAEVIGYQLKRYSTSNGESGTSSGNNINNGDNASSNVLETSIPPTQNVFLDNRELEWGKDYYYEITVIYAYNISVAVSIGPINTGSVYCKEKFHEDTGWETFCFNDNFRTTKNERKSVWTCSDLNQLIESADCGEMDASGETYYCAQAGARNAECKSSSGCEFLGNPFGMYYNRDSCYGKENILNGFEAQNFCYYDFSNTVVDQCKNCVEVNSCFDYQSKDACEVNSCLGTKCNWINPASASEQQILNYGLLFSGLSIPKNAGSETGQGYCVEENYKENDQCSLCGPSANLFENFFCTAQVCSGLGECFSKQKLSSCAACPEAPETNANCYSYQTEQECSGGRSVQRGSNAEISLSQDSCSWGRCLWFGNEAGAGSCIKDGNGDRENDCNGFSSEGERAACMKDVSAPKTKTIPEGINSISFGKSELIFEGDDSYHQQASQRNKLGKLGFCLTPLGGIDQCLEVDGVKVFTELDYPGKLDNELISANLINSSYLEGVEVNGETYQLKYYSLDKYQNQESVRSGFIFIDNVPPKFELDILNQTETDQTKLTVSVISEEALSCNFKLEQIWPEGTAKIASFQAGLEQGINPEQRVIFEGIKSIKAKLDANCSDSNGNSANQSKNLIFNLDQNIAIIYPVLNGFVASNQIVFQVNTAVGASCSLYKNGEKITEFKAKDGEAKEHQTDPVSGFVQGEYFGVYSIICKELVDESKVHEGYFSFNVDFIGPETTIVLEEGAREVKIPTKKTNGEFNYDWKDYFIRAADVSFECQNDGFACDKTYYCLGDECQPFPGTSYKEFNGLSLNQSSRICYYSSDQREQQNSALNSVICGNILIEGYGVTLENPELYYYQNENTLQKEQWGISNQAKFEWRFFTRVPTVECKFDFAADFDYNAQPAYKVLTPNAESKYVFENFPENAFVNFPESGGVKIVYVKCKNSEDELGPEQKINLEYDPSAPQILRAEANPNLVVEGVNTNLLVESDDKTVCRYSDNSAGSGSYEYATMEYSFPGTDEKILNLVHNDIFQINFLGASKNYTLNSICKNGAGNVSGLKEINFSVDYSALGNIVGLSPNGYLNALNATLEVETNKNAYCQYKNEANEYVAFENSGGRVHSKTIGGLSDKEYIFPVKCIMGDHVVENVISFSIDTKPPVIDSVDDGNYSCGKNQVKIMVYTNEGNISGYYYEVYDLGEVNQSSAVSSASSSSSSSRNSSSSSYSYYSSSVNRNTSNSSRSNTSSSTSSSSTSSSARGNLVFNVTTGPEVPLEVPLSGLNVSHKYSVRVKAWDRANNLGNFLQSDGFLIVAKNDTSCVKDENLGVELVTNESCSGVSLELKCRSLLGCSELKYDQQATATNCKPTLDYPGKKLILTKSNWVCYYVEDTLGTNSSGSSLINVKDGDGDGSLDKCDKCPKTEAGAVVGADGCSSTEVPEPEKEEDSDRDKLPDSWEKIYDSENCALNYAAMDSDINGVADGLEDYDSDTYNNYEEYLAGQDPCLADEGLAPKPEEEIVTEPTAITTTEETSFTTLLAIIFLILGLLLLLGGSVYLIYYYIYSPEAKLGGKVGEQRLVGTKRPVLSNGKVEEKTSLSQSLKDKIFGLKKIREEKIKEKKRVGIFEEFRKDSATIPHIDKVLQKKADPHVKVQELAQKYVDNKEDIAPGLRREEKSVFKKLENIAQQTQDKKIQEVLSKDEAKDIFSKLQQISKKRKA